MRNESEEHQDQDQGHIAEPGKPPHHYTPYYLQSMFCFQNKIMHVLLLLWHFATQKLFLQNIVWPKLSTRIAVGIIKRVLLDESCH